MWDDEAWTALHAENLLKTGHLTGWDGRNLLNFRAGDLDAALQTPDSPAQFWLAAASFRVFGISTWSARFPFALAGLLSIAALAFALRRDFGADNSIWLYGLAGYALWTPFLLSIRQCRYYGLALFFGLCFYASWRRYAAVRGRKNFLLCGVCAALLFYASYLLCAALLLSLLILAAWTKALARRERANATLAAALFALLTAPYALAHRIYASRGGIPASAEPWLARRATLLWWNLRDLHLAANLPWTTLALLACFLYIRRERDSVRERTKEWLFLALGNAAAIALLSPQPPEFDVLADVRYLILSAPFAAGVMGVLCWRLERLWKPAGSLFLAATLSSSAFSGERRALLPAYLGEILHPYPTSVEAAARYLRENARPDETVFAWPTHFNFPLMFYTGDDLRFCCGVSKSSPLGGAVKDFQAPLFVEDNCPDWFVSFGRDKEAAQMLAYFSRGRGAYRETAALDVFALQTQRPELPWHSFGPVTRFDRAREAVYLYRKEKR